ncbi:MAG TPA: hypothetical protein VGF70_07875 [Solirubrobacteraceae bacterium]|jgi:hypothetical protein
MSAVFRRHTLLIWTCLISLALWGCGSSKKAAAICKAGAQRLVAQTLRLSPSRVAQAASKGNNEMPQCSFRARLPGAARFSVTVNVDTSPQPYAVLSRTIEERQQVARVSP